MARKARRPAGRWRQLLDRLTRLKDSPLRVASGFAIGVFIGVAPTFGLGFVIMAGAVWLFGSNAPAAVLGLVTGAPPFIFAVWAASVWIGAKIFGLEFGPLYDAVRSGHIWKAGGDVLKAYLVGNAVVTTLATAAAFLLAWRLMLRHRRASRR